MVLEITISRYWPPGPVLFETTPLRLEKGAKFDPLAAYNVQNSTSLLFLTLERADVGKFWLRRRIHFAGA
jgi:hypothetical protein